MFILKRFKSFVLQVRILKALCTVFSEVRILKELGEKQLKAKNLKLERERLGGISAEAPRSDRGRRRARRIRKGGTGIKLGEEA